MADGLEHNAILTQPLPQSTTQDRLVADQTKNECCELGGCCYSCLGEFADVL